MYVQISVEARNNSLHLFGNPSGNLSVIRSTILYITSFLEVALLRMTCKHRWQWLYTCMNSTANVPNKVSGNNTEPTTVPSKGFEEPRVVSRTGRH